MGVVGVVVSRTNSVCSLKKKEEKNNERRWKRIGEAAYCMDLIWR